MSTTDRAFTTEQIPHVINQLKGDWSSPLGRHIGLPLEPTGGSLVTVVVCLSTMTKIRLAEILADE